MGRECVVWWISAGIFSCSLWTVCFKGRKECEDAELELAQPPHPLKVTGTWFLCGGCVRGKLPQWTILTRAQTQPSHHIFCIYFLQDKMADKWMVCSRVIDGVTTQRAVRCDIYVAQTMNQTNTKKWFLRLMKLQHNQSCDTVLSCVCETEPLVSVRWGFVRLFVCDINCCRITNLLGSCSLSCNQKSCPL